MKTSKLSTKIRAESLVFSIKSHQKIIERLSKRLEAVQKECKHPLGYRYGEPEYNNEYFKCPDCLTLEWIDSGY